MFEPASGSPGQRHPTRERLKYRRPERRAKLFEPDAFLPSQQLDMRRPPPTPEQRLLAAVLADAINCFQRYAGTGMRRRRRESHEAEVWFMSEDKRWPFSFRNICDVLGLDAAHMRGGLLRWREQQGALAGAALAPEPTTPAHHDRRRGLTSTERAA